MLRANWKQWFDGGMVMVALEKQMWGDEFGMCADRFGVDVDGARHCWTSRRRLLQVRRRRRWSGYQDELGDCEVADHRDRRGGCQ